MLGGPCGCVCVCVRVLKLSGVSPSAVNPSNLSFQPHVCLRVPESNPFKALQVPVLFSLEAKREE